jgi:hypothetical protein
LSLGGEQRQHQQLHALPVLRAKFPSIHLIALFVCLDIILTLMRERRVLLAPVENILIDMEA